MKLLRHPRTAPLLLAFASALSAAIAFFRIGPVPEDRVDWTTSFGRRLEEVRKDLPASGTVGWLSDESGPAEVWSFYQTEYALAPLRIVRGTGPEFVLGVYRSGPAAELRERPAGYEVARVYGNGVRLYRATRCSSSR